jgi:hypothetical protein
MARRTSRAHVRGGRVTRVGHSEGRLFSSCSKFHPAPPGEEGPASVTIRIDQLKDATVELIQEAFVYGDGWFISRRNALEGVVERHPLLSMQGAQGYRLLAFWRRPADVDAYEGL